MARASFSTTAYRFGRGKFLADQQTMDVFKIHTCLFFIGSN